MDAGLVAADPAPDRKQFAPKLVAAGLIAKPASKNQKWEKPMKLTADGSAKPGRETHQGARDLCKRQ
jgi:hypothetical protein